MAAHNIDYRGARLEVRPSGPGWVVWIYPGGSSTADSRMPNTRDPQGQGHVVAQAKAIVDQLLGGA